MRKHLINTGCALLFVGGLALAGSEGPCFPWPNLAGLAMFGAMALLAQRIEVTG